MPDVSVLESELEWVDEEDLGEEEGPRDEMKQASWPEGIRRVCFEIGSGEVRCG